jgi:enoyl-[acyl-carrier protein] reductase II
MLKTTLTDGLGIEHPVLCGGMARVSQAPLVAAVSEGGGMGCLGGLSYLPDQLREEIREIRRRTDKPFAVDLVVPDVLLGAADDDGWGPVRELWGGLTPEQRVKLKGIEPLMTPGAVQGQIDVVLDERPPVLALTFNVTSELVDACHDRDMEVIALSGSVGRSVAAEEAGADYVVVQGTEGGGHTGYIGTMALVPAVVDAVGIPVVAAGGIADGRGLAAALSLGAAGVWCGTRFIASDEAYGHDAYKQRILEATAKDTALTKSYSGKNLRALRNRWIERWDQHPEDVRGFPAQYAVAAERVESGYQDGDVEEGMLPAGQGVGLVHEVLPAAEIVRGMVAEASDILERLGAGARQLG